MDKNQDDKARLQQSVKKWFKNRCYAEDCTCEIDQPCWFHMSGANQNAERARSIWEHVIEPWLEERTEIKELHIIIGRLQDRLRDLGHGGEIGHLNDVVDNSGYPWP
jgi:hypothetical protein